VLEAVKVWPRKGEVCGKVGVTANLVQILRIDVSDAQVGTKNLIIALAGSAYVKDSVMAVEKLGSLTPDPASFTILGERNLERRFYGYPGLELRRAHSFADAVQETLRLLCSDRFFPEPRWSATKERQYISMRFYLPYAAASIHFGFERHYHSNQTYGSLPLPEPRSAWDLRAFRCNGQLLNLRVSDSKLGRDDLR
jgi:hypothetical protein